MKAIAPILLLPLFVSSCIVTRIHTSAINDSAGLIRNAPYVVIATVEKKTSALNLLWAITVTDIPDIDPILREMMIEHDGDAVIDVRVWKEHQVWLLQTVTVWHVKGKVIRYIAK